MPSIDIFQAHLVRQCAHRVKYTIDLPSPLLLKDYRSLARRLGADLTDTWLPNGHILFHLRLPEGKGTLSGSDTTPTLHVVLSKKAHDEILQAILDFLQAALNK